MARLSVLSINNATKGPERMPFQTKAEAEAHRSRNKLEKRLLNLGQRWAAKSSGSA